MSSIDTYSTTKDLVFDEFVSDELRFEVFFGSCFFFYPLNYPGSVNVYVCHIPYVILVDYYFKNLYVVFESDEEVTSIYRSHEKARKDANTMSLEELIAWEQEEAHSSSYLRSPHVWQRTSDINGKGKVLLDDFEAMGNGKDKVAFDALEDVGKCEDKKSFFVDDPDFKFKDNKEASHSDCFQSTQQVRELINDFFDTPSIRLDFVQDACVSELMNVDQPSLVNMSFRFSCLSKEMDREIRMTRLLTYLCHEVIDAIKDKEDVIEEVKELGVATSGSDSMAFLRILRDEDLDKAKDIMNLIKETQKHTREKYVYIAKVKLNRK
nr:transposase, MuDR, MULE transposase domain protein [Tanacetum cinerariifolium]